jgi:uncharacterized protein with beta-barrel porin domain
MAPAGGFENIDTGSYSVGLEGGKAQLRYGVSIGGANYSTARGTGFDLDGSAQSVALYAGYFSSTGWYAQGSVGLGAAKMDVSRPAAYGQIATGQAKGSTLNLGLQTGYMFDIGEARIGPFVEEAYSNVRMKGYAERGASVSNAVIPKSAYGRSETTIGVEGTHDGWMGLRPTVRVGYTKVNESGDASAILSLADLPNSAGSIGLPKFSQEYYSADLALEGEWSGFGWRAGVGVRDSDGKSSGSAWIGIAKSF